MKKLNLKKIVEMSFNLKQLDETSLHVYETHFLNIEVKDYNDHE